MMRGEQLLRFARSLYAQWFDQRHDPTRILPEELLARVYLMGAIDALQEETERLIQKGKDDAKRLGYGRPGASREAS